jgi:NhaA family Na+:H+ antiporter
MKHHAAPHQAIGVRRRRLRTTPARLFTLASDHFLLLPAGAAIAFVWANLWAESYFTMAQRLGFIVNEVGMAFFFALIAQEIFEAVMPGGALHSWRKWGLALVAATGGIVGAAGAYLAYVAVQHEAVLVGAWPIACAIDVAMAYYVLKLALPRSAVLPFVLLLGIATDAFGVFVTAFREPVVETRAVGAIVVLMAIAIAMLLRAWQVPRFWPYLALCGTACWWAFYWMGVHPALSLLPLVPLLPHEPRRLDLFAPPPDDDAIHLFEHEWNHLVQIVLFFFGLVNAGVALRGYDTGTWAVLTAALVGRPAGILIAVALAVAAGLHLPARVGWRQLVVAALATSSGFTFALFFASGLLGVGPVRAQITIGALATGIGAVVALAAARLLRVGRFRRHTAHAHTHDRHSAA